MGNCVLFLASELSSYITGTTLHPDGGALAMSGWMDWPDDGLHGPTPGLGARPARAAPTRDRIRDSTPGDALFQPDGEQVVPTEFARGPWTPDALHGGPVAALLARAVESVPTDEPMHVTRLTVELLRPVPLTPLAVIRVGVTTGSQGPARRRPDLERRSRRGVGTGAAHHACSRPTEDVDSPGPDSSPAGPVPGIDPGAPPDP